MRRRAAHGWTIASLWSREAADAVLCDRRNRRPGSRRLGVGEPDGNGAAGCSSRAAEHGRGRRATAWRPYRAGPNAGQLVRLAVTNQDKAMTSNQLKTLLGPIILEGFLLFVVILSLGSPKDSRTSLDRAAEARQHEMEEERAEQERRLQVEVRALELDMRKHPERYGR